MPRIYDVCVHVGPNAGDYGSAWKRTLVTDDVATARAEFARCQAAGEWVRMFGGAGLGRLLRDSSPTDR